MPDLPAVSLTKPGSVPSTDAVVVGTLRTAGGVALAPGAEGIDKATGKRLLEALRALDATGRQDDVHKIPSLGRGDVPLIVATGLGDTADSAEAVRRATGAALRRLTGRRRVHIAIDAPIGALVEGALLGAYEFTTYKSQPKQSALRRITVSGVAAQRAELKHALAVAEAVALTRDLVNTPPNDLYPETFAARAAELGKERGLKVEVLDDRALTRGGYGGILGVGKGSARPPRLVRLSYQPSRARGHIALVGKGITFDTGGLNLKTAKMADMKSDMGGAAAVIASVLALAALEVPIRVTATVPMAENMPSGSSYRPSDVLTMRNGSTVEVGDTDAEGRLILADAITRAVEDNPDRLIEISTLTGAQLIALGTRVIGAMGEDAWRDEVVAAGTAAGEASWAMPLPEELRAGLDTPVADIANVPTERVAGMLVAGVFLRDYVPAGLPWVHLDIAGPSFNSGAPRDYTPKGGTGAGVRTIIAAVEQYGA